MDKHILKISCISAMLGLANASNAGSVSTPIGNLNVYTDASDGVDKAMVTIGSSTFSDSNCGIFGIYAFKTKNLTDPAPKAQFNLLLSAKISGNQVTITYHAASVGNCIIDGVLM